MIVHTVPECGYKIGGTKTSRLSRLTGIANTRVKTEAKANKRDVKFMMGVKELGLSMVDGETSFLVQVHGIYTQGYDEPRVNPDRRYHLASVPS